AIVRIVYYADNLELVFDRLLRRIPPTKALSNRAAFTKILARHRLVDDHRFRALTTRIRPGEISTGNQSQSHGLEVTGSRAQGLHFAILVGTCRTTLNIDTASSGGAA